MKKCLSVLSILAGAAALTAGIALMLNPKETHIYYPVDSSC